MRIRVIDLESTGDSPPEHGVCEIGWCDLVSTETQEDLLQAKPLPGGWKMDAAPTSVLAHPGCAIPPETAAVHHIIDEDVARAKPWRELAQETVHLAADVLAAHSAKFERKFLTDEITGGLPWICTYKCAMRLWPEAPLHSNNGLRYWRKPSGLARHLATPAHRAGPDAYVTAFLLRDMLEMAPVEKLIEWSGQPALQIICHVGNQRGRKWTEVDDGFLYWMLGKDFDEDTLFTVRTEIQRREDALRDPSFGETV